MLSEHGEGCFDVKFLVSHFPRGHGGRRLGGAEVEKMRTGREKSRKKSGNR